MKNRLLFSFAILAMLLSVTGISFSLPETQAASLQLNNELIAPPPGGDPPTPDPNPGVSLDLADPATLTDCTDGLDNDEDGKEDRDDKGCYTNPYWGEYDPKDTDEVSCTDPNFPDWIYDSDPPYNGDWIRTGGSCNEHWESCAQIEAAGFEDPLPKKCLQPPPDLDGPKCYDDEGDQVECGPSDPGPDDKLGPNPAGYKFTIEAPHESEVMEKEDMYKVSGKCEPGYHVFIFANNTKNPAYALCSNQSTYVTSNLRWLTTVQKGSHQDINGYQVNLSDKKAGTDKVTVIISDDGGEIKPQCSDGIDNVDDEDNLSDANDPGCKHNGQYDPNDPDENDEPTDKPECSDDLDNDHDGKIDEKDPACHTDNDPDNPGSYNPGDDDEGDEPECSDDKDNDNDGKTDEKDPNCHTDGNPDNPGSYDPGDNDEGDDGSVSFDPGEDYVDDSDRRCLEYNPLRKINFVDVNSLTNTGAKESLALSKTLLRLDEDTVQYLLSGYGGTAISTGKANIGLNKPLTRLEAVKLIMLSHCLPIFSTQSLPDRRYDGLPMPSYKDYPMAFDSKSFTSAIIFSGSYYNIWNGTLENNIEFDRPVTLEEMLKLIVRAKEFRSKIDSDRKDEAVQAVNKRWSYEFYSKAAEEGILKYLPNALSKPTSEVIRGNGFELLLNAVLKRDLYSVDDQSRVKSAIK